MFARGQGSSWSAVRTIALVLTGLVWAADQFTKHLTITHLPLHEPVPVLGGFLQWFSTTNPGGAFSLGSDHTWIFTIALATVAVIAAVQIFRVRSRVWIIVLGLLLGGVLGNLTDRIFRPPGGFEGEVVDMISMPWFLPAVFNVADIFIVSSMILIALMILFGVNTDGSPRKQPVEAASGSPE